MGERGGIGDEERMEVADRKATNHFGEEVGVCHRGGSEKKRKGCRKK